MRCSSFWGVLVGTSGGNSVVESLPSKQMVAGSSPVPRSIFWSRKDALGSRSTAQFE